MELKNIDDLFISNGRLNSAILRRDWFLKSNLYKEILQKSELMDIFNNVHISHRIWFIKDNLSIGKCPVCGKPRLVMPEGRGNHTFTTCNCKKNYTEESRNNLVNHRSESYEKLRDDIVSSTKLKLSDDEFRSILTEMNNRPANYQFIPSQKYLDFYSDLVLKTKNVLPIETYDIPQRLYIVNNGLKELPVCGHCGKPMKFHNRFIGYDCPCQRLVKSQNTRYLDYINRIPTIVNQYKYEIVEIPLRLQDGLKIRCRKCGMESIVRIKDGRLNILNKNSELCQHCGKYNGTSRAEKDITDFIRSIYSGNVIENDRTVLKPKELDIYIPERSLAIEYDGLFWHGEGNGKDSKSHLEKTKCCESKNIHLVHIFENEWLYKPDIVKSRMRNLLGSYDRTIYARKCEVRIVDSKTSLQFQYENHIQGGVNSKVNLGLYYEGELVSLMTFSRPRFNRRYEWELVRFCNKLGYHIPGSASRLLKHFERQYEPKSIVSYADRRWSMNSESTVYHKLGFKMTGETNPNYWYFNEEYELFNRVRFQKHKLKGLLEKYDESKSEIQNMFANGYDRIFDCGNMVFVKEL